MTVVSTELSQQKYKDYYQWQEKAVYYQFQEPMNKTKCKYELHRCHIKSWVNRFTTQEVNVWLSHFVLFIESRVLFYSLRSVWMQMLYTNSQMFGWRFDWYSSLTFICVSFHDCITPIYHVFK